MAAFDRCRHPSAHRPTGPPTYRQAYTEFLTTSTSEKLYEQTLAIVMEVLLTHELTKTWDTAQSTYNSAATKASMHTLDFDLPSFGASDLRAICCPPCTHPNPLSLFLLLS